MNKQCQEVVLLSEADRTIHFVSGYITGHGGTGSHNKDSHQPVSGGWLAEGGAVCVIMMQHTTLHPCQYTIHHATPTHHLPAPAHCFLLQEETLPFHYIIAHLLSVPPLTMRAKWSGQCPPTQHYTPYAHF